MTHQDYKKKLTNISPMVGNLWEEFPFAAAESSNTGGFTKQWSKEPNQDPHAGKYLSSPEDF